MATVATVGRIMYPGLRQSGYGERFSLGLITATGAIDALIPPSILMVIYGVAAEQSIAKLFIAGIIPGLLLGGVQAAYVIWYAHRNKIPVGEPATVREVAQSRPSTRAGRSRCRWSSSAASTPASSPPRRRRASPW